MGNFQRPIADDVDGPREAPGEGRQGAQGDRRKSDAPKPLAGEDIRGRAAVRERGVTPRDRQPSLHVWRDFVRLERLQLMVAVDSCGQLAQFGPIEHRVQFEPADQDHLQHSWLPDSRLQSSRTCSNASGSSRCASSITITEWAPSDASEVRNC